MAFAIGDCVFIVLPLLSVLLLLIDFKRTSDVDIGRIVVPGESLPCIVEVSSCIDVYKRISLLNSDEMARFMFKEFVFFAHALDSGAVSMDLL